MLDFLRAIRADLQVSIGQVLILEARDDGFYIGFAVDAFGHGGMGQYRLIERAAHECQDAGLTQGLMDIGGVRQMTQSRGYRMGGIEIAEFHSLKGSDVANKNRADVREVWPRAYEIILDDPLGEGFRRDRPRVAASCLGENSFA